MIDPLVIAGRACPMVPMAASSDPDRCHPGGRAASNEPDYNHDPGAMSFCMASRGGACVIGDTGGTRGTEQDLGVLAVPQVLVGPTS